MNIPLPNVKGAILKKVIEYMNRHRDNPMKEIEKPLKSNNMKEVVGEWDAKFVEVEQEELFELILAANYMDIKPLLDLTCAKVASMIKGLKNNNKKTTFPPISNTFAFFFVCLAQEKHLLKFVKLSTSKGILHQKKKKQFVLKTNGLKIHKFSFLYQQNFFYRE